MAVVRKKIFLKDFKDMDMLLSVLEALGLNTSFFIQFLVFIVLYQILTRVLFKPYFQAFIERHKQTEGNTDWAERLLDETDALAGDYQMKARSLNEQYKSIYDASRSEAMRKHDDMVQAARSKAKDHLEKTHSEITTEMKKARVELKEEVPSVTLCIVNQLLGSEAKQ